MSGLIIFLAYNKYVMNSETKKTKDLIKIKFKNQDKVKNKVISSKNLSYAQFTAKLCSSFEVDKEKYYKLYYLDEDKEWITVNTEEDYSIFLDIEPLILYLEQTDDKSFDFRVFVEKEKGLAWKGEQNHELMKRLEQKESQLGNWKAKYMQQSSQFQNYKALYQKKLNKQEEEIAKLKQIQRNASNSKVEQCHKLIQAKKKTMLEQLQKFRKDLEQKTKKEMVAKLTEIQNTLESKNKRNTCHFQHKTACQSTFNCPNKKQITGFRFRCIVCCIDVCQDCSNEQFKTKTGAHQPNHPMVRFRDDSWNDQIVTQLKKKSPSKPQVNSKQSEMRQKIESLVSILNKTEKQAREFVLKYPNLPLNELIQKALTSG